MFELDQFHLEQDLFFGTILVNIYCKSMALKLCSSPMEVPCTIKDAMLGPNKQAATDFSANVHPHPTYITHTLTMFILHECFMAESKRTSIRLCYKCTTHK